LTRSREGGPSVTLFASPDSLQQRVGQLLESKVRLVHDPAFVLSFDFFSADSQVAMALCLQLRLSSLSLTLERRVAPKTNFWHVFLSLSVILSHELFKLPNCMCNSCATELTGFTRDFVPLFKWKHLSKCLILSVFGSWKNIFRVQSIRLAKALIAEGFT
jgi:hypothetical protein